jgi:hypothetical protein
MAGMVEGSNDTTGSPGGFCLFMCQAGRLAPPRLCFLTFLF